MIEKLGVVLLLLLSTLTHRMVRAEPAPAPQPATDATVEPVDVESLLRQGIALRQADQDSRALEVFRAAFSRAPTSMRIRAHLGTTYQALGQWVLADRHLRVALRHADDPYVARHRVELAAALEYVDDRLGQAQITGTPSGADVRLGGAYIGSLPLESVVFPAGSYVLEIRMNGYYTVVRPVTIEARGFLRETVELLPTPIVQTDLAEPESSTSREPVEGDDANWLIGTSLGLGGASVVTAAVAWIARETYASRFNGADCLSTQRTRGENCGSDRQNGRTAERVAIVSGISAGVFLSTAAVMLWLPTRSDGAASADSGCSLTAAGVNCFGSF